ESEGVFTSTAVTIGYDTPWRQVHALLLLAAERTSGLRANPKPLVLQAGLEDFYVKYTLLVCLEQQQSRPFALAAVHANIQDLFNEHGVQIMSPNYVLDPAAPKIVPKERWFDAPARGESARPAAHDIGTIHSTRSSAAVVTGARPAEGGRSRHRSCPWTPYGSIRIRCDDGSTRTSMKLWKNGATL